MLRAFPASLHLSYAFSTPNVPRFTFSIMETTRRVTRSAAGADERISSSPPRKKARLANKGSEMHLGKASAGLDAMGNKEPGDVPTSTSKTRKTKAKAAETDKSEFLERLETPWKIGAHVSSAGGVENAVVNAAMTGANSFALFLKSQRKWTSPPLSESSISEFKRRMKEYGYTSNLVLPHGSYLINLGNPDLEKREKSFSCFLDDVKRCEALGLELYNFHPGSTVGAATLEESITHIADCINRAHTETKGVTIVLENMAGAGNIIGGEFAHLGSIIEKVEDKSRVGVCMDTCHAFAAGYDIRTKEGWGKTMAEFEEKIGLQYLRGMHINDSKTEHGSHRDRHENIGLGHLTLQAFKHVVRDPRTQNIPLILETPSFEKAKEVWGVEINVLGRLAGACSGSAESAAPSKSDANFTDDSEQALLSAESQRPQHEALVEEVRAAVKLAEACAKPKKVKTKNAAKRRRKGEQDDDDNDDHDEQ
ncbi:unnamed protein product [Cyclocybe aegerita]|uniref:Apurinic-apyrimidinic endonuclease 1 n=1 Tax=Cyclocybe aegerita TaxID=1973307 RepID=A0A8S0X1S7_CYCAE|nr:unnamed protein product [Cyclocybe aegerita]